MKKIKDAEKLWFEFQKIRLNIDKVESPNLSKIKEIVKRVHFANVINKQQTLDNEGDVFYKIYEKDEGRYFRNRILSYTITPEKTGLFYGTFKERKKNDGTKVVECEPSAFNDYARFMADIAEGTVIYSKELKSFVQVLPNKYSVINENVFSVLYAIEKKGKISDFLQVLEQIYSEVIQVPTHHYTIQKHMIAGLDWVYDCKNLELTMKKPAKNVLYFDYYDVHYSDLNMKLVRELLEYISDGKESLNNITLLHAYAMQRKMKLVPAEKFFIFKDSGRTGKGLVIESLHSIFNVNQLNFDALSAGGFEASNERMNLFGCDIAHAGETGDIDPRNMRFLRQISTNEVITARTIGNNTVKFKSDCLLVLDTNENVDVGDLTANKARTVKVAFRARDDKETDLQRHAIFKPYWSFVGAEEEKEQVQASLSFLLNSFDYLKKIGGIHVFQDVAFKNYRSASELTDTQILMLQTINEQGYILANDKELQGFVYEDYTNLKRNKAKEDMAKIGVRTNVPKKINGKTMRVHIRGDKTLFYEAHKILKELIN